MNEIKPCECIGPGFCKRHKKEKSKREIELCQNDIVLRENLDRMARKESNVCIYRGKKIGSYPCAGCNNSKIHLRVYKCDLFDSCIPRVPKNKTKKQGKHSICENCPERELKKKVEKFKLEEKPTSIEIKKPIRLEIGKREFPKKPIIYDTDRNSPVESFKNKFKNQSIFFIGSGPSLLEQDLSFLSSRGIVSFAVNNIAAKTVRPNFWTCVDDPSSFHESIFYDPGILKFLPWDKGHKLFNLQDGKNSNEAARDCPNVYLYKLMTPTKFNHKVWLTEDKVSYGCERNVGDSIGLKSRRSVMFAAIKLIYYMGFTTVFLLGCDFNMQHDEEKIGIGKTYAFEQYKHPGGCSSNNKGYYIDNERWKSLLPAFEKNGFSIYNCTPNSRLDAFPFTTLQEAIELATIKIPRKINTFGYYGGIENKNKFGRP